MDTEDRVLVVGGPEPSRRRPTGRPRAWAGAVVVVPALLVWAVWSGSSGDTEPEPSPLAAPIEPTTVVSDPAGPDVSLGADWIPLVLRDDGYVRSISTGSGEWLVVTSGFGIQVHTSPDAVSWVSKRLSTGSATVMTPTTVAGERMVVAGTDVLTARGRSWISTDAGSTWETVPVSDDDVQLTSVSEIDGEVYVTGATLPTSHTSPGADGGSAAVWRLQGSAWDQLPFSQPVETGSVVTAVVDRAGSAMAVGSDRRGLAVWSLDGTELTPVAVSGGGDAHPDAVSRLPDGRFVATLSGGGPPLVSADLTDWGSLGSAGSWRYVAAGDTTIGIGYDHLEVLSEDREPVTVEVSMGLIGAVAADDHGVVVAGGASDHQYSGVLWIHGISQAPAVTPATGPPS